MEKVTYSKFSNDRAPKYNIITEIGEKENKKFVRKIPASKESIPHVESIYEWSKKLGSRFKKAGLSANRCHMEGDVAYFEFISGKTFESVLDELISAGDKEAFMEMIQLYISKVETIYDTEPFEPCEEFSKVFGKVKFDEPIMATKELDIDLVFSNIIIKDEEWVIIDYEWTFDFPIPLKFLYYRVVNYFLINSPSRKDFCGADLLKIFGISKSESRQFFHMEQHLQMNYIMAEHASLHEMYGRFGRRAESIFHDDLGEMTFELQVYYDFGEGFAKGGFESHAMKANEDRKVVLELDLPEGLSQIRLDPGDAACTITVLECISDGESKGSLAFTTNGIEGRDNYYIFLTNDPQIHIDLIEQNPKKIRMEMEIELIQNNIGQWLLDYLHHPEEEKNLFGTLEANRRGLLREIYDIKPELSKLVVQADFLKTQNENLKTHTEELSEKYHQEIANILAMQNSTSWKVTRPLRALMRRIKRNGEGR